MSTPQPPSAEQLSAARLAHWRQNSLSGPAPEASSAILTIEAARRFVSTCGLVLFTPRPQLIASPAPTFVEATLGASNAAASLAESAEARSLLARLIAEGNAVPLNLLGAPSTTPDAPDFVASAAAFAYVFTLRGDKAWKQPPATSGASKMSPLALNTYTLIVENGPASAYDLATQLGKEVTEAAVLRSLNELWQHLRVLPVPQTDGRPTLWELVAHRFTKQLKAGANAGQPTALSALISLYLSQALLATEEEIETFLSPLAPRSRVRDVLHALTGARQLETVAIEGKTHLHIHGELPTFADAQTATAPDAEQGEAAGEATGVELAEDGSRIKKFVAKPRKVGTGYIGRAKPFTAGGSGDRERRPPMRQGAGSGGTGQPGRPARKPFERAERPAYNKPWDEEKQQREAARAETPDRGEQEFQDIDLDAASSGAGRPESRAGSRPFASRAGSARTDRGPAEGRRGPAGRAAGGRAAGGRPSFGGDRPAFSRKPGFGGGGPSFPSRDRGDTSGEGRPPRREFKPREGGDARPPRREFPPREGAEGRPPRREFSAGSKPGFGGKSFGPKKTFGKGSFGDRKQEGGTRRPFTPRPPFGDRPDRGRSDDRPRPAGDSDRRSPRRDEGAGGEGRPPRREFPAREGAAERPKRPYTSRGESGASGRPDRPAFRKFDAPRGPRKPFAPREDGEGRPPRREFPGGSKPAFGPKKGGGKPGFGGAGSREGFGGKGKGGFAGARGSSGKPAGDRPTGGQGASTFDKFKGGNKPWGKRPPARKPRPDRGGA